MKVGELTVVHPSELEDGNLIVRFPATVVGVVGKPQKDSDGGDNWWINILELHPTGPGTRDCIMTDKPVTRVDWNEEAVTRHEAVRDGKLTLEEARGMEGGNGAE